MIENSVMPVPSKSVTQVLEEAITEALIQEHEAQIVSEVVEMAAASMEKAVAAKVPTKVAAMPKMLRLGTPVTRGLLKIKDGPMKAWPIEQEHAYPDGHRTQRFVTTTLCLIRVTVAKKDPSPQKVYWALEVD